jgi:hypothetical protein
MLLCLKSEAMTLSEVSSIIGIIGGFATVGCLYYAWRNDAFIRFLPKDQKLQQVFSQNENDPAFIDNVHATLQQRVQTKNELHQAFAIAKQMHFAKQMDEALIEINKRAIELYDFNFAYKVATSAHFAVAIDQMLMNIINASLPNGNVDLANKCANRMHFAVNKDISKKKILSQLGLAVK